MQEPVEIFVFVLSILFGVTIVAILVGLITDSVASYMNGMAEGRSKVVDSGHTLILGCVDQPPSPMSLSYFASFFVCSVMLFFTQSCFAH